MGVVCSNHINDITVHIESQFSIVPKFDSHTENAEFGINGPQYAHLVEPHPRYVVACVVEIPVCVCEL